MNHDVPGLRRRLLKSILVASGAATTASALPEAWVRPVVDSVMLPVHAQTSLIDGRFGGSGVAGALITVAAPVFDVLVPRAYAGGIDSSSRLDVCATVSNNNVTDLVVRFNQSAEMTLFTALVVPVEVPGIVDLNVGSGTVTSGTIQFDGPGSNGLAGQVTLGDGGSTFAYPFDIAPGTCPVVLGP